MSQSEIQQPVMFIDLRPILDRLERIEQHMAGQRKPELLRAPEAIAFLRTTKARFYRLVESGEIEQIKYEDNADALYDTANLRDVIQQHKSRNTPLTTRSSNRSHDRSHNKH